MKNVIFNKIVKDAKKELLKLSKKNGWLWFYNIHQKEVMKFADKLLTIYKKANRKQVLIACWFHDIAHYYATNGKEILEVKKNHHLNGAKIAEKILKKYNVSKDEIEKIKNCILRHRNSKAFKARTLEEKIVVVADTLSHFSSIFYLTYFKFHPEHSLEQMVKADLEKIDRDWKDLNLLPVSRKMVAEQYFILKKMLCNYNKK